ncbi:MAG: hypothetical protein V3U48_03355, partial [Rhodospirillales bacterium]
DREYPDHSQCHFGLFCHFPVLLTDISQIAFKSMAIITKTRRHYNGFPSSMSALGQKRTLTPVLKNVRFRGVSGQ